MFFAEDRIEQCAHILADNEKDPAPR